MWRTSSRSMKPMTREWTISETCPGRTGVRIGQADVAW